MNTPEDFLDEEGQDDYFGGETYGDFAYKRAEVIRLLTEYGKQIQEAQIQACYEHASDMEFHFLKSSSTSFPKTSPRVLP